MSEVDFPAPQGGNRTNHKTFHGKNVRQCPGKRVFQILMGKTNPARSYSPEFIQFSKYAIGKIPCVMFLFMGHTIFPRNHISGNP